MICIGYYLIMLFMMLIIYYFYEVYWIFGKIVCELEFVIFVFVMV